MPSDSGVLSESSHAVFIPLLPIGQVDASQMSIGSESSSYVAPHSKQELKLVSATLPWLDYWCWVSWMLVFQALSP